MKELLRELCTADGVSGYEDAVRELIISKIKDSVAENQIETDINGNLYVHIENKGAPRLMICAHMDEIGFMVTGICENGLLKFGCVGGIDPLCLSAKRIRLENGLKGCIISKPIHLLTPEERKKRPSIKNMYADIGARTEAEAWELVSIGDYFTFDSDFIEYGDGLLKCKAIDDRLGCAVMVRAINEIKEKGILPTYDLYFVFGTREEVGFSGSYAATEKIKPDISLVLESKASADVFGVSEEKRVCLLGEGVIISFADRSTIYDRGFFEFLRELLTKNEIKNQTHTFVSGGNDSSHIQRAAGGCVAGIFSLASRYIHSPADVISYEDLLSMEKGLMCLITNEPYRREQK